MTLDTPRSRRTDQGLEVFGGDPDMSDGCDPGQESPGNQATDGGGLVYGQKMLRNCRLSRPAREFSGDPA